MKTSIKVLLSYKFTGYNIFGSSKPKRLPSPPANNINPHLPFAIY